MEPTKSDESTRVQTCTTRHHSHVTIHTWNAHVAWLCARGVGMGTRRPVQHAHGHGQCTWHAQAHVQVSGAGEGQERGGGGVEAYVMHGVCTHMPGRKAMK